MSDSSDKTEKPSQKRIEKSRKEGNFPSTRQFLAGVQFVVFVVLLEKFGGSWMHDLRLVTTGVLLRAFGPPLSPEDWLIMARDSVFRCIVPLVLVGLGMSLLSLALQFGLTAFGLAFEKVAPDFKRLNPVSKVKNMASQNLPALFQAILLLPVCGYAIYALASENADRSLTLPMKNLEIGVADVTGTLLSLLWRGAYVFFIFGSVELFREKLRHSKQLKMSKQELKDEHKESEGSPQVKQRMFQIRRDNARKSMMKQVPTATAVIVNPTHYAVALRYDQESMAAPVVVAKGKNYLALRIKKLALDHQVPLIENPPLAQGLYKAADVGQEIPPHLYRAVAEILAYIVQIDESQVKD